MSQRTLPALASLRRQRRSAQLGYLLVELALVLIITSFITTRQFGEVARAIETAQAKATAQYAVELQSAVNVYALTNLVALKQSAPVPGFANAMQPTVAELLAAKFLPSGFPPVSPLGLLFRPVLTTNCPAPACVVTGQAYTTKSLRDPDGDVMTGVLSDAVSAIGIDGSMSLVESPALLTSLGGGATANPMGNMPGILSIRIGSGSGIMAVLSQYYKLDGTTPLAATMDANNNDITNIKDLQVMGTSTTNNLTVTGDATLTLSALPDAACTAGQEGMIRRNQAGDGLVACSSGKWNVVGNAISGIADGSPCAQAGQVGTTAAGVAFVCNGAFWSLLQESSTNGAPCAPAGRMAKSIVNREELVCKNGVYVKLVSLLNKNVEVSRILVSDGSVVAKPSCDTGGTPAFSFGLTQTVVDVSVVPPRQAMYAATTDNGSSWSVLLRVRDDASGDYSANSYGITAVLKLECSY
jgi:hypothetical protein